MHSFEIFSLREWTRYVPPYPTIETGSTFIPCMFCFTKYVMCKLQHCPFSHSAEQVARLRGVRDASIALARDRQIGWREAAHHICAQQRQMNAYNGVPPIEPIRAPGEYLMGPVETAPAASAILPYVDRGVSVQRSGVVHPLQRFLDVCVIAPPAHSVRTQFVAGLAAPTFSLPAYARLHRKLSQELFDKYFTVAKRRRIQWSGCPLEVTLESSDRWRVTDANHVWIRLCALLAPEPTSELQSMLRQLVFVNRAVENNNTVVMQFESEYVARSLVAAMIRIRPEMGGLFMCMGRPAYTAELPLSPLVLQTDGYAFTGATASAAAAASAATAAAATAAASSSSYPMNVSSDAPAAAAAATANTFHHHHHYQQQQQQQQHLLNAYNRHAYASTPRQ
jgi:hypothetical protein